METITEALLMIASLGVAMVVSGIAMQSILRGLAKSVARPRSAPSSRSDPGPTRS